MELLTLYVLPAVAGIGIGILSGLLGVGGGTIMVPIFRLAFGMSAVVSTATSLFAIIPTSVSGAVSHVRNKTCVPSLGIAAGLGGALTSPVGVWLAQISPDWLIMLAAALIIGWSAVKMLGKAFKMKAKPKAQAVVAGAGASAGEGGVDALVASGSAAAPDTLVSLESPASSSASASSAAPAAPTKMTRKQLLIGAAIGLVTGVASGYVGVGGGFMMVPLMLTFAGLSMVQVSGTSLIAVMILAIPGAIEQMMLGNINYVAGIAVVVGSIPGAFVGARLVRLVPERTLRFIFGGFLLVAAILLVLNEFGIL